MEKMLSEWKELDEAREALNRRRGRLWLYAAAALLIAIAVNLFVMRMMPGVQGTPMVVRIGAVALAVVVVLLCLWLNQRMIRENNRLCDQMDALAERIQAGKKQFVPSALRRSRGRDVM